mmetsp:Transcript_26185/g.56795  ORF Transcript_26185/g.56795 Transcript_26185/m.56795 type:complete len:311 (-) Transcript_26185:130-1062(-)
MQELLLGGPRHIPHGAYSRPQPRLCPVAERRGGSPDRHRQLPRGLHPLGGPAAAAPAGVGDEGPGPGQRGGDVRGPGQRGRPLRRRRLLRQAPRRAVAKEAGRQPLRHARPAGGAQGGGGGDQEEGDGLRRAVGVAQGGEDGAHLLRQRRGADGGGPQGGGREVGGARMLSQPDPAPPWDRLSWHAAAPIRRAAAALVTGALEATPPASSASSPPSEFIVNDHAQRCLLGWKRLRLLVLLACGLVWKKPLDSGRHVRCWRDCRRKEQMICASWKRPVGGADGRDVASRARADATISAARRARQVMCTLLN